MRGFSILVVSVLLAGCSDGTSTDNTSPSGMTSEQSRDYDNLSSEGKDYVDDQMEQYDEACASSSDC